MPKKKPSNGDLVPLAQQCKTYFDLINRLDKDDYIEDGRCKFCQHPLRQEAEEIWERTHRFRTVVEFFQKGNQPMTMKNVRTHIRNHYLRQEQLVMRRHYAERLLPVINHKIDKMKRIETFLTMLEDKAWKYASLEHENDMNAQKSDDMLIKIVKELVNLIKLQAELEGDLRPVQVVVDKVQQIFVNVMSKIDDPKLKMEVTKELESLKDVNIIDG